MTDDSRTPDPAPAGHDPALSASEAARWAGVNERTIRRAITAGKLAAEQTTGAYRIDPETLAAWAATRGAGHVPGAMPGSPPSEAPGSRPDADPALVTVLNRLITQLNEENAFLRETLASEIEARRRADHLVAGLMERLPELSATVDVHEHAPQDANAGPLRDNAGETITTPLQRVQDAQGPVWRRWWRRVTGGG